MLEEKHLKENNIRALKKKDTEGIYWSESGTGRWTKYWRKFSKRTTF